MLSNQLYREYYMGKAEIWNFSTSLQLDISQVSAVIFHILQAMERRKIVEMVNFGKELENEKKWNEKNLEPCMNVFLNFDLYTTLDLFHPKRWLQKRSIIKEIETWKVARIGYETAKWLKNDQCWKRTQFYGLRTKWMKIKSYGNLN